MLSECGQANSLVCGFGPGGLWFAALTEQLSEKSAGWIRKKLEVNGGPSRKLRPSR